MSRLSDPKLGPVAFTTACRRAGYIFGAFTGAIVGSHYWGTRGAVAVGIALFATGWILGNQIGALLKTRLWLDPR